MPGPEVSHKRPYAGRPRAAHVRPLQGGENRRSGFHIRPRGVGDAAPYSCGRSVPARTVTQKTKRRTFALKQRCALRVWCISPCSPAPPNRRPQRGQRSGWGRSCRPACGIPQHDPAPRGSRWGHQSRESLLMCDKEAIEVQKILPFLSDTWPLCRIGRAVIRASQSCRQSCNKSQCPACGCRSRHSCTHARRFSQSFPARGWGSILQKQGAFSQSP